MAKLHTPLPKKEKKKKKEQTNRSGEIFRKSVTRKLCPTVIIPYIHTHTHTHTHIYIYIYRPNELEIKVPDQVRAPRLEKVADFRGLLGLVPFQFPVLAKLLPLKVARRSRTQAGVLNPRGKFLTDTRPRIRIPQSSSSNSKIAIVPWSTHTRNGWRNIGDARQKMTEPIVYTYGFSLDPVLTSRGQVFFFFHPPRLSPNDYSTSPVRSPVAGERRIRKGHSARAPRSASLPRNVYSFRSISYNLWSRVAGHNVQGLRDKYIRATCPHLLLPHYCWSTALPAAFTPLSRKSELTRKWTADFVLQYVHQHVIAKVHAFPEFSIPRDRIWWKLRFY